MDNIDVSHAEVTRAEYAKFYDDLAKRNLGWVESGIAHQKYKLKDKIDVWHVQTLMDTYPRARAMLERLGVRSFYSGLDVGCGTVSFFDFFPVQKRAALDLVYKYCQFIKYHSINADSEMLPIQSKSMDVVICSDIFEHVLSFDRMLSEVKRVMRGLLVVAVPWKQELKGKVSDFAHLRTFSDFSRFVGLEVLDFEVIEHPHWLTQVLAVMK